MYWFAGQWFNQETITLSLHDPGLLYGATVFTTLRVYQQSLAHPLTRWPQHLQRLSQTLHQWHWPAPDWPRVAQAAQELAPHYPVLRLTIFADGRPWLFGRPLPENLEQKQKQGIQAWLANAPNLQRSLADHKTGNYLTAWLAQREAQGLGAEEAILLDTDGHWLETSTGNLWGWREGEYWTPPAQGKILPGISRAYLIEKLTNRGAQVHLVPWTMPLIKSFAGLAYSNSVVEVIPIRSVVNFAQVPAWEVDAPELTELRKIWA